MSLDKTKTAISLFMLCFLSSSFAFTSSAQTPQNTTGPATPKVTLASLLEKTIKASQETQATLVQQQGDEDSSNIAFPPEIDLSYSQALNDIDQNIGTNVRWGGEVLESMTIDDSTVHLTVYAHPLSDDGQPIQAQNEDSYGGRFVVHLINGFAQNIDFRGNFLTFYGTISSKTVLTNSSSQKSIPVISALEFVDWNSVEKNAAYASNNLEQSYYILDNRPGYRSHYYSTYYSNRSLSNRYQASLGNRVSSRSLNSRQFRGNRTFSNRLFKSHKGVYSRNRYSVFGFRSKNRSFNRNSFNRSRLR